ncbi:hypothetical protein NKH77_34355 [Streptomyces sp. M19]
MPPVNRAYHAVDYLLAEQETDTTEWLTEQFSLVTTQLGHIRTAQATAKQSRRRRERVAREVRRLRSLRGWSGAR